MSGIMKVFLLIAVMFCISEAQSDKSQQCLCQRLKNRIVSKAEIKEIQIYQATVFCTKVEIVVTQKNGFRYCLNPELAPVKKLMTVMMNKQKSSTASPSDLTYTAGSTSTGTSTGTGTARN
ncbi:C-X-C motif chemokine 6-like [Acanthochromis polyacanthus]|uniref:C-X-C motif chemokine 6-like n=1 Tax=Acanthochromis polyacanthus TaxID=80966 RepID=A0A3Q1EUV7_9TELE|nr:C-X-C motif chemokine 6-like [Acanthochromis polyacanthus]